MQFLLKQNFLQTKRISLCNDPFVFSSYCMLSTLTWLQKLRDGTKIHQQIYNTCWIPIAFQISCDEDSRWPLNLHGFRLGKAAQKAREDFKRRELSVKTYITLQSVGFAWDFSDYLWEEKHYPALKTYKELEGNLEIPTAFIVPAEKPWPRKCWGMKLGSLVSSIRQRGVSDDKKKVLDGMGFAWNGHDYTGEKGYFPALRTFNKLYGHSRVPSNFIVPEKKPWAKKYWGLKLGRLVRNIRDHGVKPSSATVHVFSNPYGKTYRRPIGTKLSKRFSPKYNHNLD